jgi:RHS repeat-associated protein
MKTISKWLRCVVVAATASSLFANAGTITYYHNDLLGSPVAATNASGQVIWRETYRPYGERLTNDANSAGNKVWYTSRRQDADTGLVYMGARYYDPVVGRFMGMDPKLFDEANVHSFNRYAYANNSPYRYVDPDGRWAQLAVMAARPAAPYIAAGTIRAFAALGGLGSGIGLGIYNATHPEADANAAPSASEAKGDSKDSSKDTKRLFDKDQRERAKDRSRDSDGDPTCEYCGVKTTDQPGHPNSGQTDHIDAWSKGGRTSDENAAHACRTCNTSKGNRELGSEWVPPGPWR